MLVCRLNKPPDDKSAADAVDDDLDTRCEPTPADWGLTGDGAVFAGDFKDGVAVFTGDLRDLSLDFAGDFAGDFKERSPPATAAAPCVGADRLGLDAARLMLGRIFARLIDMVLSTCC